MKGRKNIVCSGFYLENTLLFTILGIFWIAASLVGFLDYWNISMILVLLGISMTKPMMRVCKNLFNIKRLKFSSCLSLLTASFSIGIPLGIILGFFFVSENLNWFIPTFTGLIALIFLIVGLGSGTIIYTIAGIILGGESIASALLLEEAFAMPGIVTGVTLFVFAFISRFIDYFITQDYFPHKEISFESEAQA